MKNIPLFLSRQQQRKVLFFQKMADYPDGDYLLHPLSKQLNIHYQPLLQMLREINEELRAIGECSILNEKGQLHWKNDPGRSSTYLKYLLSESIPFQFLISSLFAPDIQMKEFLNKCFLSKSTMQRRMKPLNDEFAKYGISINLSQMALIGDEQVIRMLYVHYLWQVVADIQQWTSHDFSAEEAFLDSWEPQLQTYLPRRLAFLILAISRIRNESNHFLPEQEPQHLLFSQLEIPVTTYLEGYLDDSQQIIRNSEFINFLIHYYPPVTVADSTASRLRTALMESRLQQNIPIYKAMNAVIQWYEAHLPDTFRKTDRQICRSNIIGIFLTYELTKGPIPLVYEPKIENRQLFDTLPPLEEELLYLLKGLSRELSLSWLSEVHAEISHSLFLSLLPFLEQTPMHQLQVGLFLPGEFADSIRLLRFLENFSFVEVQLNPTNWDSIDLYITSEARLVPHKDTTIFVVSPFDRNYLERLTCTLIDCLQQPFTTADKATTRQEADFLPS